MLILSAKQKAFAMATAVIAFAVVVGTAIQFIIENVPGYVMLYVAGFAVFCFMFNMIYQILLMKFEGDEKFKKTVDK
jgi:hypothetical protein